MKPTLAVLILATVLAGCRSTPQIAYSAASGTSLQDSVAIAGTANDEALDKAERAWIAKTYPASRIERRSIQGIQGRHYSVVEITTANGERRSVHFDISDYFSHH
jgi:hypothetical protein